MSITYKNSGVDIEAGSETVRRIKDKVKSTFTKNVLTGIGGFGGLFDFHEATKNYSHPVMVQSIDGVGTKLIIAQKMNKFDTVGMDIVNHCSDDVLAMGARPLTFLDYVANETLNPEIMEQIVTGMVTACKKSGISLVGGETAEMPGTYLPNEHDIAGCITGVVEKDKIITGENIKEGNIILGFASNGLHTNGYSLARKLFFEIGKFDVTDRHEKLNKTIGETLLAPHINYVNPIVDIIDSNIQINGIAHITGGGFIDNIPRVLPENLDAEIAKGAWPVLPVFEVMQELGEIEENEMYRSFNMGIGLTIIINETDKEKTLEIIKQHPEYKVYEIGKVIKGNKKVILK